MIVLQGGSSGQEHSPQSGHYSHCKCCPETLKRTSTQPLRQHWPTFLQRHEGGLLWGGGWRCHRLHPQSLLLPDGTIHQSCTGSGRQVSEHHMLLQHYCVGLYCTNKCFSIFGAEVKQSLRQVECLSTVWWAWAALRHWCWPFWWLWRAWLSGRPWLPSGRIETSVPTRASCSSSGASTWAWRGRGGDKDSPWHRKDTCK